MNKREALGLSGKDTVADAAASLGERVETVVVTLAAEGAMAVTNGSTIHASAETVDRPVDTTGAETSSPPPTSGPTCAGPSRRSGCAGRWSTRPGGLRPDGVGGAVDLETLLREGAARGLTPPPHATDG